MVLQRCVDAHPLQDAPSLQTRPATQADRRTIALPCPQNALMQLHTRHCLAPQPLREGIEHHSHKPMQRNQMLPV